MKYKYSECNQCIEERIPPIPMDILIMEAILAALKRNDWIRLWAANDLNITHRTLYNYIRKMQESGYEIKPSPGPFMERKKRNQMPRVRKRYGK